MNNLVKFLILGFLILWPASLSADEDSAYIKCDNLEATIGPLDIRKREMIVELDVADKYYVAAQWIGGSKNISHFWSGEGSLSLLGNNDEFYRFDDLWLWQSASNEKMLIKALELIPLRADNRLNENFVWAYFAFQNLKRTGVLNPWGGEGYPRLNRETLILTDFNSYPRKDYKCRLIDEKEADAEYEKLRVLFEDNWTETLKRDEELKTKEQKEKEEQRERFKL
tara:strand:+ start:59 stop:733 length:675 start_codon:yes stop_codon:yes gene_type:complete